LNERFGTIGVARSFIATFVEDYKHTHHHSGIGR
jgi:putative transposase